MSTRPDIVRLYMNHNNSWTDDQPNHNTVDLMFLPRPASESQDSWPQSPLFDPDPYDRSIKADDIFTRVSSAHEHLRWLIGGPTAVASVAGQMLKRITSRRHLDTHVAPFVELAAHYKRSHNETGYASFCRPITGSGPMGAMNMNDDQTIALALDGTAVTSFPPPEKIRQWIAI